MNGREKQTNRQNTESGQSRHIETLTVGGQGKVKDNPNGTVPGRVTRRAEWTSSAGVGEGGIRKKCKSVEDSGVTRNNTRSNTTEDWERRSVFAFSLICSHISAQHYSKII